MGEFVARQIRGKRFRGCKVSGDMFGDKRSRKKISFLAASLEHDTKVESSSSSISRETRTIVVNKLFTTAILLLFHRRSRFLCVPLRILLLPSTFTRCFFWNLWFIGFRLSKENYKHYSERVANDICAPA